MHPDKLKVSTTTDGKPPREGFETASAPAPIKENGQHEAYWVLSEEERQKGFVRPVRSSYKHVGAPGPQFPLRELTAEEKDAYTASHGFVRFEDYPAGHKSGSTGKFWSQKDLDKVGKGCGTVTTMGKALSETYAAQPHYYGSTFCCGCGTHLAVGEDGEFVWSGTTDRVGV
jgi:hypothetical protein